MHDAVVPRIESASGTELARAFSTARSAGLRIRLEPHLDWAASLNGGTYEWRRRMYIDPSGQYFSEILQPLCALRPDELTLGSELDVSAYEFAEQWQGRAETLRQPGLDIGHKLNHDWHSARQAVLREANTERAARGLPEKWMWGYGRPLRAYLKSLDYVAVSYYPPGDPDLDEQYTIGEFGLGSTDITRPWHFDASTFRTPADFAVRRGYYLRFLEWLRQRQGSRAACFWTAGHFDVLGVMDPAWRDDAIVEAVVEYNSAVSRAPDFAPGTERSPGAPPAVS